MTPSLEARLRAHAEQTYPDECVGALLGHGDEVREVLPLENSAANRRTGFALTAREYLRAEAQAEARGLEVLGLYHSHPDAPAVPSARDAAVLRSFRRAVIISVRAGVATEVTVTAS